MCGIAGFLTSAPIGPAPAWERTLTTMGDALTHRGPDSSGTWHDAEAGIGLAHRRLAIIDLSVEGSQPMLSPSGRYVIVFNGEIYNFRQLRETLAELGHHFRGGSDTEILLAAIEQWGLAATLPRLAGMFALALWDRGERRLYLARDRLGKKPLYLAVHRGGLLFGSELKAIRAFPGYDPGISADALAHFLRYSFIPETHCIYAGAAKLAPGTWWSVDLEGLASLDADRIAEDAEPYWSLLDVARAPAQARPTDLTEETDRLHDALSTAVAQRMISDVPLGAFLSGGIDSSLVVALMREHASQQLRTFTIGFREPGFDEAGHGRAIAALLGTDHTDLYAEPDEALSLIPILPEVFDEPFADPSQIPTILVSRLARQHITVALTGDGGDETFGGYDRYGRASMLRPIYRVPHWLRSWAGRRISNVPEAAWDRGLSVLRQVGKVGLSGREVHAAGEILALSDGAAMYRREMVRWDDPPVADPGQRPSPSGLLEARWSDLPAAQDAERMMYVDTLGYLPSDILVKVDRASMASSLEVRSPLLDHRVIELAWQLPLASRNRGGIGKIVLRNVLARYLPRQAFERPKQGFGVPIAEWLRGPLRPWAEELLDEGRLRREGVLDPAIVRGAWDEHLAGRRDQSFRLWTVLMLQTWLDRWRPGDIT